MSTEKTRQQYGYHWYLFKGKEVRCMKKKATDYVYATYVGDPDAKTEAEQNLFEYDGSTTTNLAKFVKFCKGANHQGSHPRICDRSWS
jgi:hypothetical protein